jgi:hypothetical protein
MIIRKQNCSRGSADHALEEDGQDSMEMAHFHHQQSELKTKGHDFVLQHLSNPTWCDECGDFNDYTKTELLKGISGHVSLLN